MSDNKPFKIFRVPDAKLISEFSNRSSAVRAWDIWYRDGSWVR